MLNVNDLEIRHKKYKRRLYAPYFRVSISIAIALVLIISYAYYYNAKINFKEQQSKKIIKEQPVTEQKSEPKTIAINQELNLSTSTETNKVAKVKKPEEQKKVILSPSLDFMHNIQSNKLAYYENESVNPKTSQTKQISKEKQKVVKNIEKIKKPVTIEKKSSINIERRDDEKDIKDVIKRFEVNNNPALSLFVAKKYYKLGLYKRAYNYALLTNEINNNIEASWIIFSKSLAKMNKRKKAIQTLKKYISYSNSSQAKQLLDEIISGKFK